jgi:cell wall-associated NlpC family hydrolase
VRYVFQQSHVDVPRTVAEQAHVGQRIDQKEMAPGDLVFFAISGRQPTHVGIAIDGVQFVHAPGNGRVVRVERIDTPYWTSRLHDVRRLASAF